MAITASLVSELRQKTGVGLMECKKVLVETNGDIEKAVTKLREKGLAKAAKKSDRSTNEGKIFTKVNNPSNQAVILELNCETDFVASNEKFSDCGNILCNTILTNKITDLNALQNSEIDNKPFKDFLASYVLTLGENISVKRFEYFENASFYDTYIHMNGKIGTLISFSEKLDTETSKSIAMHVAAANPTYLNPENVNAEELENEKSIIKNQALKEGKPEQIVDKIVNGRISKYYKEVCLIEQPFIKDDKQSIKDILPKGCQISHFSRFSLS